MSGGSFLFAIKGLKISVINDMLMKTKEYHTQFFNRMNRDTFYKGRLGRVLESEWFLMAEVKRIRCGSENCYLIEKKGRAILIDTGREGYAEKILAQCTKLRVELIILTHGHLEQVQNAAHLSKKLNAPLAIHRKDLGIVKNNFEEPVSYQGFLGMVVAEVATRSFDEGGIPDFTPDLFLKEGDRLDSYGIDGSILELPGHTRGSIGVDLEKRAVFVGDALMNLFYPGLPMIYCDKKLMMKSAEKISLLGARKVYFCHGAPAENRVWGRMEN